MTRGSRLCASILQQAGGGKRGSLRRGPGVQTGLEPQRGPTSPPSPQFLCELPQGWCGPHECPPPPPPAPPPGRPLRRSTTNRATRALRAPKNLALRALKVRPKAPFSPRTAGPPPPTPAPGRRTGPSAPATRRTASSRARLSCQLRWRHGERGEREGVLLSRRARPRTGLPSLHTHTAPRGEGRGRR